MEWCTIESDPGVFTELIEKIGVKGISVEEVYSLDDRASLDQFDQIYGFIFLFRFTKNVEKRVCLADWDPKLFFAQQVVQNACGTQAILSVIMNDSNIELGEDMSNFKEFSMDLDPQSRGMAIGQSDLIRTQHNAFARPDNFVVQEKVAAKEGDAVFHFVSYVPFKNQVQS
jgi:ubiquitin carboxyl-terminal hydrolase L5